MTGRCKKQSKVMAGDCNADETTKIDNPNFDTEFTEKPSGLSEITELPQKFISGLDSYCQAYKSVAFCSPYDSEESPPPAVSVTDAKTLPNRVWHLLVKQSDGRKRKKSHSSTEKKSLFKAGKSIIWVETEEYFRELTVEDIERLERVSGDDICLRYNVLNNRMSKRAYDKDNLSLGNGRQDEVKEEVVVKEENESTSMDACENDSLNLGNGGLDEVQEVTVKEETEPTSMDGDGNEKTLVEFENKKESNGVKRENGEKYLNYFSGLEWLLASRNKVYLASERPSKKRKLLGSDAGLEKLLMACPVEGLDSVCHYCSYGERGDPLNCLIKCASCGMMVHQRCYGVTEDMDSSWLCSWCKWKNSASLSTERPCLLCPKSGGALKPVEKSTVTSEDRAKFAHLFCCQWMPEVYLENTRTMEPIMNINGLNDTKKKLICYLCKVKWGASVWCSNGACRTSFHPICAREAKHRMEIWGKLGCDEVELRAFCSKHSGIQYNRRNRKAETSVDDSVSHIHKEIVDTASESHKSEISQQNGDKSQISVDTADTDPSEAIDDSGGDFVDSRSSSESQSENGDVLQSVKFLPHQRKAEGIRTVKDDKSCQSEDKVNNVVADDVLCPVDADSNGTCTESTSDVTDKMLIDPSEQHNGSSINGSLRIEDEIEGELIYYQQRILYNALQRKQLTDDLISKVARTLPLEIDAAERIKWDAVLVSQYNHELKEAKKKGKKERQNKEAQAVLAAATAAAATSSRLSARKDAQEDSATHEDLLKSNPRVTNTVCRSNFSKDGLRICEICTRSQTILNPVLVCSSCKVAVHLDCYRSVKSTTGPWQCELCEDLFSSLSTNSLERKPYFVAECGLCGGTASAFRKSVNGQWIHALCAEWVLESKYRRGQVKPIEGMETVSKGNNTCTVCHRKQGACLKCSYGHCHSMFHPTCARSAGFYMTVRTSGGKLQQKAYCARHSSEQRAKADTRKHGVEEFKSLKQVRVELERLRLLCERIIKREKLKRELVLCSHDILSSNRDSVLCTLARHPFYQPEVSSESATTSIRGYSHQSGSDTIQRSDDITIDSTFAGNRHVKIPVSMDNDQRTVDSSTSHNLYTLKPTERVAFSGKQIQRLPIASLDISEDAEARSNHKKHAETFGKELIMTSDQASIRNQRLPKGFVYVPIRSISKDKKNDSYVPDVSGT